MKSTSLLLCAILLGMVGIESAMSAEATPPTSPGFAYATSRGLPVDITVSVTDNRPALLSFYSEGNNGPRLLESVLTDNGGHYAGKLRAPAHLTQVLLVIRTAEGKTSVNLPISNDTIHYPE